MQTDFTHIDYLQQGNAIQQKAYKVLTDHHIFDKLKPYDPILVGTIPIEIDIEGSDLDIACCCSDITAFKLAIERCFSKLPNFTLFESIFPTGKSVVARCMLEEFELEIFGQATPTQLQWAYRHMIIEENKLRQFGESFRKEVLRLKKRGMKTEPAFAHLLKLEGDPYEALLLYKVHSKDG